MDEANVYVKPNGKRNCRACHRLRQRQRRARKREPERIETSEGLSIDDLVILEVAPAWVRQDDEQSRRYVEEERDQ